MFESMLLKFGVPKCYSVGAVGCCGGCYGALLLLLLRSEQMKSTKVLYNFDSKQKWWVSGISIFDYLQNPLINLGNPRACFCAGTSYISYLLEITLVVSTFLTFRLYQISCVVFNVAYEVWLLRVVL